MKTIRMPRRMGEITERMPAPQYDNEPLKRTRSQPQSQMEIIDSEGNKPVSTAKPRLDGPNSSSASRNSTIGVSQTPKQTTSLSLSGNSHVEVESSSLI